MPHRHPVRIASATVLMGLLAACGSSGSGSDADERLPAAAVSVTPLSEPESKAAGDEAGSAAGSLTASSSGVPGDVAASYKHALGELRPAFDRFAVDYAAASEKLDADSVLAAAASLRRAVIAFDTVVRGLDLEAVQYQADTLVELNHNVVETLDAVGTATSGAQAVRIMEMLPFRDYVLAFDAVADAL